MLIAPIMHIEAIDRDELNRLLVAWGHRMGMVDLKNVRLTVNVVVPRALARQIVEQLTPYAA